MITFLFEITYFRSIAECTSFGSLALIIQNVVVCSLNNILAFDVFPVQSSSTWINTNVTMGIYLIFGDQIEIQNSLYQFLVFDYSKFLQLHKTVAIFIIDL